jgi:xylulokinase
MRQECVLALDLGTTAFKAAPVNEREVFGRPAVIRYRLDYTGGRVTCPPERYLHAATQALRQAARTAQELGLTVRAIGICSQAQTFLALDKRGEPLAPAFVWTDDYAQADAQTAAYVLPDFARTSGFVRPSPLQFLPKVMHFRQNNAAQAERFLLLNEWLIAYLTSEAYGDETNQGMGGFWDIERRDWSRPTLELAGLTPENFAVVAPAASHSHPLKPEIARALGLPVVPVYSCGNDQSVAAIGVGLDQAGDILCNFGTAMVVYALRPQPVAPVHDAQISGISPLDGWFLLGLESECGNVIDWLARLLFPRQGVPRMINAALAPDLVADHLPQITRIGGGSLDLSAIPVGCTREQIARAVLEFYAAQFASLLNGVGDPNASSYRLFAGGGLSQSDGWLNFLSQRIGLPFLRTSTEHPSLIGIARLVSKSR